MAELDIPHEQALSTIIECMLHTIQDLVTTKETNSLKDVDLVKAFNHLFNFLCELTTGKYGDQTDFIKKETKRLIRLISNTEQRATKTLEDIINEQLDKSWSSEKT